MIILLTIVLYYSEHVWYSRLKNDGQKKVVKVKTLFSGVQSSGSPIHVWTTYLAPNKMMWDYNDETKGYRAELRGCGCQTEDMNEAVGCHLEWLQYLSSSSSLCMLEVQFTILDTQDWKDVELDKSIQLLLHSVQCSSQTFSAHE